MLREAINAELARRDWPIRRLSDETGVRYPTLTDYLSGRRDISAKNLEKALEILGLNFASPMFPYFVEQLKELDGTGLPSGKIDKDDFAHLLFGVLVSTAGYFLQEETPGYTLNYGDLWDKFVAEEKTANSVKIVDIPLSLQKREFVRIIQSRFSEKQKAAVALLLSYQPTEYCNRVCMLKNVLAGMFSDASAIWELCYKLK